MKIKILIALVITASLAYWFISRKPWSTLKGELKEFAIKDTAKVTRMFFADKKGNKVLLQRNEKNEWMINNLTQADADKVNLLLATMHDLEVRNPITEKEHNTVVGILATEGIKTEFYKGEDLIKTIYIGSSTPDQTGTYMLIEGSDVPYVTHVNGFIGYLTPRFITSEKMWKSKEVFNISASQIKKISVEYPMDMKNSFVIENGIIPILKSNNIAIPTDVKFLKYYLGNFEHLFFEGYSEAKVSEKDSIFNLTPFCVIILTKANGEQIKLQVNLKAIDRRTMQHFEESGKPLDYDIEKYFAFINNSKDMIIIQQHNFGKLFRKLDEIVKLK